LRECRAIYGECALGHAIKIKRRILYLAKLYLRNEGEIKTFQDNQKLWALKVVRVDRLV
jgi:hypothetical protein